MITSLYVLSFIAWAADGPAVFQAFSVSNDKPIVGRLEDLSSGWSAKVGEQAITAGDLIEFSQLGLARPMFPWERPHILLINGDRWPGQFTGIKDDQVRFVPAFGKTQELTLPVSSIAIAWMTAPRPGELPDPGNFDVLMEKRQDDDIFLTNNDVLKGTVTSMDRSGLKTDVNGRATSVALERVRVVAFNTELSKPVKPRGSTGQVILTSGARITLTEAALQDGRIVGKTFAGPEVRLILSEIVRLEVRSDRVVSLGDLRPLRYDHTPYLGTRWPFATDRSTLANRPLRLGPHVFDRGIAMHSQSRLTYAVPAGARRFETWAGLDAEAGRQGNVKVQIALDGKVVVGPDGIAGATPPKRIVVAILDGAKELSLDVEFGAGGDVQDHFVWGDARFILPKPVERDKP